MRFLWPHVLLSLMAVPALVTAYIVLLLRKKDGAIRYASLSFIKDAIAPGQRFRRHIPPLVFLLALIAAIVAIARPTAVITLPSREQTIILVMDVSLSMGATDVDPNRLTAAQAAAKAFVEEQPTDARVGIVAFGASASLVQPPTKHREDLLAAIDRFKLQNGTATGSALYVALATLFPDEGIDLESLVIPAGLLRDTARGRRLDLKTEPEKKVFKPVLPGSYTAGVIMLMSDGRKTSGPEPLEAAQMAADHGVRVFTVGFGNVEAGLVELSDIAADVRLDEETLKAVADITRGEYFQAATATELGKVYKSLNSRLVMETTDTEITFLFAAASAMLMLASGVLSLLWFNRIGDIRDIAFPSVRREGNMASK